jgi:hypothetical protein
VVPWAETNGVSLHYKPGFGALIVKAFRFLTTCHGSLSPDCCV